MRALITGCAGQDGYYLAQALEGEVFGLYRGQDEHRLSGLSAELPHVTWIRGDVTDPMSMQTVVSEVQPDWVFNLAAASFVGLSWAMPRIHMETNCLGVLNLLEAVKRHAPEAHVIQASTSEMFGNTGGILNEESRMSPASPYGVSKLAAHELCRVYRESYGMHVSCAISFNHESPRRPPIFVTRKVTQAAARGEPVSLGTLDTFRDWGFAGDYAQAYILMAKADEPDDYVIGTGQAHSIRELAEHAYGRVGMEWQDYVQVSGNPRPNEVDYLCANPAKINALGWQARTSFEELVGMMVDTDREVVLV